MARDLFLIVAFGLLAGVALALSSCQFPFPIYYGDGTV